MWFPVCYRANHFHAHTAPVDARRNCVHAIERYEIPLPGCRYDIKVVVPQLFGSVWMLCSIAHVSYWNLAVSLQ